MELAGRVVTAQAATGASASSNCPVAIDHIEEALAALVFHHVDLAFLGPTGGVGPAPQPTTRANCPERTSIMARNS